MTIAEFLQETKKLVIKHANEIVTGMNSIGVMTLYSNLLHQENRRSPRDIQLMQTVFAQKQRKLLQTTVGNRLSL